MKNWIISLASLVLMIFLVSCGSGKEEGGVAGVSTDPTLDSTFVPDSAMVNRRGPPTRTPLSESEIEFVAEDCPNEISRVTNKDITQAAFITACQLFSTTVLTVEEIEIIEHYVDGTIKVKTKLSLELPDEFKECPEEKYFIFNLQRNLNEEWEYSSVVSHADEMRLDSYVLDGERINCIEEIKEKRLNEVEVQFGGNYVEIVLDGFEPIGRVAVTFKNGMSNNLWLTIELPSGQTRTIGGLRYDRHNYVEQYHPNLMVPGFEYFLVPDKYNLGYEEWPAGFSGFKILAYSLDNQNWIRLD